MVILGIILHANIIQFSKKYIKFLEFIDYRIKLVLIDDKWSWLFLGQVCILNNHGLAETNNKKWRFL